MSEIEISDLTEVALQGNGVFDQLMQTVQLRLDEQFAMNRIKGTEYATVYLGSMESVLAQSTGFLLQGELIGVQKEKIRAEIELINAQKDKMAVDLLIANVELLNTKLKTEILELQRVKTDAEARLLDQKVVTETAQTEDTLENGNQVTGVIGTQKALLVEQKIGFRRKVELNMAKLLTDVWSIRRTTNEGTQVPVGIRDDEITLMMTDALEKLNITVTPGDPQVDPV